LQQPGRCGRNIRVVKSSGGSPLVRENLIPGPPPQSSDKISFACSAEEDVKSLENDRRCKEEATSTKTPETLIVEWQPNTKTE
jgi:hypothetical protein